MNGRKRRAVMARCPECHSRIYFNRMPEWGHRVVCRECDARLEVVELIPLELDWADDDDDDYDFEFGERYHHSGNGQGDEDVPAAY